MIILLGARSHIFLLCRYFVSSYLFHLIKSYMCCQGDKTAIYRILQQQIEEFKKKKNISTLQMSY